MRRQTEPQRVTAGLTQGEISSFIKQYYTDTGTREFSLISPYYADQVDYYSKGFVSKDFIKQDKEIFFKRWTTIKYEIEGEPEVSEASGYGTKTVRFASTFLVSNQSKSIAGKAETTWTLKHENSGWKIIAEQQRVLSRE